MQLDFDADESAQPVDVGEVGMSQDIESSEVVGATQEDEASLGESLQIEGPWVGEGIAYGSGKDKFAMAFS